MRIPNSSYIIFTSSVHRYTDRGIKGCFPIREKTGLDTKTDQTRPGTKPKSGSYKKPQVGG